MRITTSVGPRLIEKEPLNAVILTFATTIGKQTGPESLGTQTPVGQVIPQVGGVTQVGQHSPGT